MVSSANGLRGVQVAYDQIVAGEDPLDAIIAGVNIQELDPDDQSVGLGGLPNAEGVVQLDASCMHGPTRRAGAVGCIEDIATPSLVAKAVMDYTDHICSWASTRGGSRWRWASRRRTCSPRRVAAGLAALARAPERRTMPGSTTTTTSRIRFTTGTINMNAVTAAGDMAR